MTDSMRSEDNRWRQGAAWFRGEVAKLARSVLVVSMAMASASCQAIKAQRAKERAEQQARAVFVRDEATEPFVAARVFYGNAAAVKQMIEVQDDMASSFRGKHRVGDGLISIGIKDGRGQRLRTHECGGHLFVEAEEGKPCQIVVRNNAKSRLEIVVGMDETDAIRGGTFNLENQGIVVSPLQTVVIGKVKRRQPPALHFGPGRDVSRGPVAEARMTPSQGSILICAFRPKDRFPWEGPITKPAHPMAMPDKFPPRGTAPEPYTQHCR